MGSFTTKATEVACPCISESRRNSGEQPNCGAVSFETPLAKGLRFERRDFHVLFATDDRKGGMAAFVEKAGRVAQPVTRGALISQQNN